MDCWRNGSAFDSRSKGYPFKSGVVQLLPCKFERCGPGGAPLFSNFWCRSVASLIAGEWGSACDWFFIPGSRFQVLASYFSLPTSRFCSLASVVSVTFPQASRQLLFTSAASTSLLPSLLELHHCVRSFP
ncbi:hypothetical protein BKA61DRAFT_610363 [Leptodontidium sp. MPI-SDFR-AT-0119]|nr:hypothetical protein BKA61DRAFT_610363 [Leptodontidium sp. MPI-SDFR-AT-0119]